MNQKDIDAFNASGLKPIVIDEDFDFSQLGGVFNMLPRHAIDWALLRMQKGWLLGFSDGEDAEYANGLLSLLDHIQDNAVATGQATEIEVFGPGDGE